MMLFYCRVHHFQSKIYENGNNRSIFGRVYQINEAFFVNNNGTREGEVLFFMIPGKTPAAAGRGTFFFSCGTEEAKKIVHIF